MNTHIFILPSGVECEICELTGEHQEIYLNKKYIKEATNHIKFIKAVVVRLGKKKGEEITEKHILNLISQDARCIMLEIKKFAQGEEVFEFEYSFTKDKKNFKHPISINLDEVEIIPCKEQFSSYEEVNLHKKKSVILPKSKKEVFFYVSDLQTELESVQNKDVSILSIIESRKPFFIQDDKEIQLDIRKTLAKDVNFLGAEIRKVEGFVDTIVQFENPYQEDDLIAFDFLTVKDFLFQGLL